MDLRAAPTSPTLTTSSYSMLSPRAEFPDRRRARSSTASSLVSSSSSFELADAETASEGYSESGDEIVWSLASTRTDPQDNWEDGGDFVVLSRPSELAQNVTTPVRSAYEEPEVEDVPIASLRSRIHALSFDAELDDPLHTQASAASTSSRGLRSGADKKVLDDEEDQKTSRGQSATSKAQGLLTPHVTPKREVGAAKKPPLALETPSRTGATAPHPPRRTKAKKKKSSSKRPAQAKHDGANTANVGVQKSKKKKSGKKAASFPAELTPATQVDSSVFQEASDFISSFLSKPEARSNSVCRLTLLQSLIIELGLISSILSLPASLKAAKTFLKSTAFLNIKEYILVRNKGQEAIRKALYPSRNALIRALRAGKSERASLKWVKDHGLQVLLVGCFH